LDPVPIAPPVTTLPPNTQFWRPRNQISEESRLSRRLPASQRNNIPVINKSVEDLIGPRRGLIFPQGAVEPHRGDSISQHTANRGAALHQDQQRTDNHRVAALHRDHQRTDNQRGAALHQDQQRTDNHRFSDNRQFDEVFSEGISEVRGGGTRFTIPPSRPHVRQPVREQSVVVRNGPQFIPESSESPVRAVHVPSTSFRRRHPTSAPFRFNNHHQQQETQETQFSQLISSNTESHIPIDELPIQKQFSQRGPLFVQSENTTPLRRFRGLLNTNLRRPVRMAYPTYYAEYRLI